jgi:hypothetical protein
MLGQIGAHLLLQMSRHRHGAEAGLLGGDRGLDVRLALPGPVGGLTHPECAPSAVLTISLRIWWL